MDDQKAISVDNKRVTIAQNDRLKVYSAPAWCGWADIISTIVGFLIISFVLGVILFFANQFSHFFDDFFPFKWLNTLLSFLMAGIFDLSLLTILALALLWLPYFLLYQLSPKKVWIEDNNLCHRFRLLGVILRTRRIPFDRILEIEIKPSGKLYNLQADPRETENLALKPELRPKMEELANRIRDWQKRTGDTIDLPVPLFGPNG